MRIVLFILLLVIVAAGVGIAILPLSFAAGFAAKRMPALTFASASGSVWNGRLTQVVYSGQSIGDVAFRLQPAQLIQGRATASLGLVRSDLSGEGQVAYEIGSGRVILKAVKLSGNTTALAGLPLQVRTLDGEFRMELDELAARDGACERASGVVWTDVLTRGERQWGWIGPEISGPVACEGGAVQIDGTGRSPAGDDVSAKINLGLDLTGSLVARVQSGRPGAADSLSRVGFRQDGDTYVLQTVIGSR